MIQLAMVIILILYLDRFLFFQELKLKAVKRLPTMIMDKLLRFIMMRRLLVNFRNYQLVVKLQQ